ncbi:hypothetical protein [Rhizobium sp. CCGE531]|uniref:hypothetical protein n=1 Tax=Rhizobium sp. CCGE531 TaxID=2364271 RepID=UPI000EAA04C1|nr:hypothetical protein [Rhizobium sp. CCGE531]AYG66127.1 hypothetical protein CCGE531_09095 [Rhizobium sp. CCGE531]
MTVRAGLQFAMDTGFAGHKLGGFYRSLYAPGDGQWHKDVHAMARAGLYRLLCGFGGASVALDLPYRAWSNPTGPWRAADMDSQSAGGHCVPITGYDQSWIYCMTWGQVVAMDWAFLASFSRELYFAYAQDWLTPTGSADLNLSMPEVSDTFAMYGISEIMPVVP